MPNIKEAKQVVDVLFDSIYSLESTFLAGWSPFASSSRVRFWPAESELFTTGTPLNPSVSFTFTHSFTKSNVLPRIFLSFLETVLLVVIPTLAPVTVVAGSTTTAASTATATTTATTGTAAILVGANIAGVNVVHLLVTVFLLRLDEQLLVVELGLGVKGQELLLLLLGLELNENASLKDLFGVGTTETNGVDGAIGLEECLDISLGSGTLLAEPTEALGIDAAGHGAIGEDLGVLFAVNLHIIRQRDLALDGGVVIGQIKGLGCLEGLNNGAERLESAHALEGVQDLQGNGVVLAATDLGEEELIHGEVGIGEIELNLLNNNIRFIIDFSLPSRGSYLLADLDGVVSLLLLGGVKLDIVGEAGTATTTTATPRVALL